MNSPHRPGLSNRNMSQPVSGISLLSQTFLEQNLPEPPKFTSAEGTVTVKLFEKSFFMKYGRLSDEQQVNLLETKYLGGKAEKVYKGLMESEKTSVKQILHALSDRLRISFEDETAKAKKKWATIKILENQSIEDFCLKLDEIARIAYKRVDNPAELSSIKCTKLMDAVSRNTNLLCLIDTMLMGTPEAEQYEACRKLAMRFERTENENAEKVKVQEKKNQSEKNGNKISNASEVQKNSNFHNAPKQQENFRKAEDQNWFNKKSLQTSSDQVNVPENGICAECKQVGGHEPSCSLAPKTWKRERPPPQCFTCGEMGHISTYCPKRIDRVQQQQTQPNSSVNDVERDFVHTLDVFPECCDAVSLNCFQEGKIGKASVKVLIDSGATISLIGRNNWDEILQVNESSWVEKLKFPEMKNEKVYAANVNSMALAFAVTVDFQMGSCLRSITFHVADVWRETVILGRNEYGKMGIQLCIGDEPVATDVSNISCQKSFLSSSDIKRVDGNRFEKDPLEEEKCSAEPGLKKKGDGACGIYEVHDPGERDHSLTAQKNGICFSNSNDSFSRDNNRCTLDKHMYKHSSDPPTEDTPVVEVIEISNKPVRRNMFDQWQLIYEDQVRAQQRYEQNAEKRAKIVEAGRLKKKKRDMIRRERAARAILKANETVASDHTKQMEKDQQPSCHTDNRSRMMVFPSRQAVEVAQDCSVSPTRILDRVRFPPRNAAELQ